MSVTRVGGGNGRIYARCFCYPGSGYRASFSKPEPLSNSLSDMNFLGQWQNSIALLAYLHGQYQTLQLKRFNPWPVNFSWKILMNFTQWKGVLPGIIYPFKWFKMIVRCVCVCVCGVVCVEGEYIPHRWVAILFKSAIKLCVWLKKKEKKNDQAPHKTCRKITSYCI